MPLLNTRAPIPGSETFARFLHIVSALDSVAGLPLSLDSRSLETLQDPYLESDFNALLAS
jgi:hypothetical protein